MLIFVNLHNAPFGIRKYGCTQKRLVPPFYMKLQIVCWCNFGGLSLSLSYRKNHVAQTMLVFHFILKLILLTHSSWALAQRKTIRKHIFNVFKYFYFENRRMFGMHHKQQQKKILRQNPNGRKWNWKHWNEKLFELKYQQMLEIFSREIKHNWLFIIRLHVSRIYLLILFYRM